MVRMRSASRLLASTAGVAALVAIAAAVAGETPAPRQGSDDVKAHYDKHEVLIPMRDGVRLFTIVYTPKDTSQRYPFMLTRTAYGIPPYGPEAYRQTLGPSAAFAAEGYIFVYQDIRGKWKSEGEFVHHRPVVKAAGVTNESTDTYDTIAWLLEHIPHHNGRVGQWGISWAGWQVSMGMIDAHPAIRASSPQAPPQDQFLGDDYHSGGAFQLAYGFSWMSANARARKGPNEADARPFEYPTPDGYRFFLEMGAAASARQYFTDSVPTWNDFMQHGTYDEYWQARNVPKDLVGVTHPVLIVAGWLDAEDFYGPFRMYRAIERQNPGNRSTIVTGPWVHGGWARGEGASVGAIDFGSNTSAFYRTEVELPFFNAHLKDKGRADLPEALMFETGGNRWRRCDAWPPRDMTPRALYLRDNGTLAFDPPQAQPEAADTWISDPRKPVPYTAEITPREGRLWVVEDQRFVSSRPDVMVYESEPLVEDLTLGGPIQVNLFASTTGTDADWVVKLVDVFPDDSADPSPNQAGVRMGGYQLLLAGDILRGKFRTSFTTPEPMVPGQTTKLSFELGDRYHTFRKGHRLMVHLQSSWFPMFDRNPQTFVDIYHAKPADYRPATQRVYRHAGAASHLILPLVKDGCPAR